MPSSQSEVILPTLGFYAHIFLTIFFICFPEKKSPFLPKVIVAVEALPIVLSRKDRSGGRENREGMHSKKIRQRLSWCHLHYVDYCTYDVIGKILKNITYNVGYNSDFSIVTIE